MDNKYILFLIGFFLISSCRADRVEDLSGSSENDRKIDRKYNKSKEVDWLKMDLFLKPTTDYVKRYEKQHPGDSLGLVEVLKEADEMMYFNLKLSVTEGNGKHIENYGIQSRFEQDQRIHYLAFTMQNDLYLSQGDHKVPCTMFHFERNYSLSPHRTFIVGFSRKELKAEESVTFVFDSEYFQTGPLKLTYSSQDIFDSTQIEN